MSYFIVETKDTIKVEGEVRFERAEKCPGLSDGLIAAVNRRRMKRALGMLTETETE